MIPNFLLEFFTNLVGCALFRKLSRDGQLQTEKWGKQIQLLFMKCVNAINVIVMELTHCCHPRTFTTQIWFENSIASMFWIAGILL